MRVVPIIVFSLIAGTAADVFDRRKLMLITQVGGTLVASTLAALAFAGVHVVWPIYLLAAVGASVGAFDPPARHALMPMLVPRSELPNAINLNTVMVQAALGHRPRVCRSHQSPSAASDGRTSLTRCRSSPSWSRSR